jgi:hypothetical protein
MKADEVRQDFEARLRKVEEFRQWARGGLTVLGIVAAAGVTVAVTHLVKEFPGVSSDVAVLKAKVPAVESTLAASNADLQKKHAELLEQHNRLRRQIVVVIDRQGGGPIPEGVVHWGKVLRKTAETLTILPDDMGDPAYQFALAPDVKVVDRAVKALTLDAVREGVTVGVWMEGGKAAQITVAR